jgi:redox-sensitive bicupin YhaK (pirin superfamily)
MSNIQFVREEKAASIGDFLVGRLLPFREKRSVGPFVFVDHMGPVSMDEKQNLDIPPHPHIGLSTLTYLFEGSIMHRDSLGTKMEIEPGDVNWMTAGKGIVHSERTPDRLRGSRKTLHGLQIWVALPKELEEMNPTFSHIKKEELPTWLDGELELKLIAGQLFGKSSPVPVHSPLFFLEIRSENDSKVDIGAALFGESAIYVLEGKVTVEGNEYGSKQLLIANNPKLCSFEMKANTIIYVFGGAPFPEERYMDWNFVASEKKKLIQAKDNWISQKFPTIPDESGFVPYPTINR